MRRNKLLIGVLLLGIVGLLVWLSPGGSKKGVPIKTEQPVSMDVINKRVISGTLVPCKEVVLKAELAGIIEKLYVSVGDRVAPGTKIARIKVIPSSSTIEKAKKCLQIAQIKQKEATSKYQRCQRLFQQNMLSQEQYEAVVKAWELACAEVEYAQKDLDFVLSGHIEGTQGTSNTIKSTIAGIVAALPCKEGSVVMERSGMQEGSNIATISDMNSILFVGRVNEMDVGQLYTGMQFEISLLAVKGKRFLTTLTKISPKALEVEKEDNISKSFEIEGTVQIKKEDKVHIRAGYTALGDIILEKAVNVLAIKEKCIHTEDTNQHISPPSDFEQDSSNYFVWVYENNQQVKKPVELGVSDGLYVEIKQGLTAADQVIITDDSY